MLCDFMMPFVAFLQSVGIASLISSDYHRFHLIVPKCNFSHLVLHGIMHRGLFMHVVSTITPYWTIIANESFSQMTQNIFLF